MSLGRAEKESWITRMIGREKGEFVHKARMGERFWFYHDYPPTPQSLGESEVLCNKTGLLFFFFSPFFL